MQKVCLLLSSVAVPSVQIVRERRKLGKAREKARGDLGEEARERLYTKVSGGARSVYTL